MPKPLILASRSPYKRALLERLGLPFTTADPAIDETPRPGESAAAIARRLAHQKALFIAGHNAGTWALGADQAAECAGKLLGKPGGRENAIAQLLHCSGRTAQFYTALALAMDGVVVSERLVATEVAFRELSEAEVAHYVSREEPYDCAGSFRWERLGITLFRSLRSDDPTALEGLPLIAVTELLIESGINPLETTI